MVSLCAERKEEVVLGRAWLDFLIFPGFIFTTEVQENAQTRQNFSFLSLVYLN